MKIILSKNPRVRGCLLFCEICIYLAVKQTLPILFVFVDGLGLGSDDPSVNPLADRVRFPMLDIVPKMGGEDMA